MADIFKTFGDKMPRNIARELPQFLGKAFSPKRGFEVGENSVLGKIMPGTQSKDSTHINPVLLVSLLAAGGMLGGGGGGGEGGGLEAGAGGAFDMGGTYGGSPGAGGLIEGSGGAYPSLGGSAGYSMPPPSEPIPNYQAPPDTGGGGGTSAWEKYMKMAQQGQSLLGGGGGGGGGGGQGMNRGGGNPFGPMQGQRVGQNVAPPANPATPYYEGGTPQQAAWLLSLLANAKSGQGQLPSLAGNAVNGPMPLAGSRAADPWNMQYSGY